MKRVYKLSIVLVLAIVVVGGVFWGLNKVEKRDIVLTNFKQEQEYQFGNVPWNSSVEEVEELLDCTLKDVTVHSPEKDYAFYDFSDVVYVLNGHEAKASVEFRADKLVYVDFAFRNLENPKTFVEDIITVWHNQYGSETAITENEKSGYIGYRWLTEVTQLLIEKDGTEVIISLTFLN